MALLTKVGVTISPNPAGLHLLGSIERVARTWTVGDLTITAGSDSHPIGDVHTLGQAFDLRTHGLSDSQRKGLLERILADLQQSPADVATTLSLTDIWYARAVLLWFGQIENYNQPNEHLHIQLRNGRQFPQTLAPRPMSV